MSASPPAGPPDTAEAAPGAAPDWARLAATPEFEQLHRDRQRFTLTGMAILTGALLLVMGLYGFAPDAMGKPAIGEVTWALVAGAALVVLTFVMATIYTRKATGWEKMSATILERHDRPTKSNGRSAR